MVDLGEIIFYAQELERRGLVHGTSGNISVFDPSERHVWVTPTTLPYAQMVSDDLVCLDLDTAQVVKGHRRPTSEVPLHLGIYRQDPAVQAVVHTHSLYATMFAVANRPIPATHYTILSLGDEIPVVPYARFGSDALAQHVVSGLSKARGVLMQNHGAVAVGANLAEAFHRAETVEWLAHLTWGASLLGSITVLSPAQLMAVREAHIALSSHKPLQHSPTTERPAATLSSDPTISPSG